jgi:cyclopropane fatty-acyl-phospholipid synthase-like methyltransferase
MTKKEHWEQVFSTKQLNEVSWYQPLPKESLCFIKKFNLPKNAAIIDVGGGDSFLVDYLLADGYTNITVLDISAAAIQRVKNRLGAAAEKVTWIVEDILNFKTNKQYDCWHDRAAFHFLTNEDDISKYIQIAQQHLTKMGKLVIGTFSTSGPEKCSGLPIKQYNETLLSKMLRKWFNKIKCITIEHATPFKTTQNFIFCSFQKLSL